MNQPPGDWKKKYLDNLAELERREKRWQLVESTLRRCVSRLSFIGDGIDARLDEQLEQLRNRVRGEQNTKALLKLIDDISTRAERVSGARNEKGGPEPAGVWLAELLEAAALSREHSKQARKLTRALSQQPTDGAMLEAAKTLLLQLIAANGQPPPGRPGLMGKLFGKSGAATEPEQSVPDTRTAVRQQAETGRLLVFLSEQLETRHLLPARFTERVRDPAHQQQPEALVIELVELLSEMGEQERGNRLPSVADVLLQLIDRLDITPPLQARADAIKGQLADGVESQDIPQILTALVALAEQARIEAEKERREVERFLLQMTEQLQLLDQEVNGIGLIGGELIAGNRQRDAEMHHQVTGLQESLDQATDLNELKLSISERLNLIQTRLRGSRGEAERLVEGFEQRIDSLTAKIGDMEEESAALRESVAQARCEAFTDALTGLNNRHAFDCRLEEEFARWRRYNFPLSLIIVDVDHFKKVNDTYGHLAGDKVLHVIGTHLKQATRATDFPARYGGEEFVVLLPEVDLNGARSVAEKIRQAVEEKPFRSGDNRVNITVSCGVASFRQGDARRSSFERADEALYRAKRGGRNRCCTEDQVSLGG